MSRSYELTTHIGSSWVRYFAISLLLFYSEYTNFTPYMWLALICVRIPQTKWRTGVKLALAECCQNFASRVYQAKIGFSTELSHFEGFKGQIGNKSWYLILSMPQNIFSKVEQISILHQMVLAFEFSPHVEWNRRCDVDWCVVVWEHYSLVRRTTIRTLQSEKQLKRFLAIVSFSLIRSVCDVSNFNVNTRPAQRTVLLTVTFIQVLSLFCCSTYAAESQTHQYNCRLARAPIFARNRIIFGISV